GRKLRRPPGARNLFRGGARRGRSAPGSDNGPARSLAHAGVPQMNEILSRLGLDGVQPGAWSNGPIDTTGPDGDSAAPSTGRVLGTGPLASLDAYEKVVTEARRVFAEWRMLPAPKRGEIVREVGEALRVHKDDLGALVT